MKVDRTVVDRLDELIVMGERVAKTRRTRSSPGIAYCGDDAVDYELAHQWGTSCLSLLSRAFAVDGDHYQQFHKLFDKFHDYGPITKALGILRAAKDDYEHGLLFNTRVLVEAEVFDDFLEQAEHLRGQGYYQAAAVIAGCVLEDGLRKLCMRLDLPLPSSPKLDQMNSGLAKQGVYTKLVQKRITMLADIRNKAAHGKWNEFNEGDAEDMIRYVRSFMEEHFA